MNESTNGTSITGAPATGRPGAGSPVTGPSAGSGAAGRIDAWAAVSALADRSRRALFDYVRHAGYPVSREDAAAATRMSRNLAAFHLDKLVEAGLLVARYQAPTGRPRGRGRTPKVYAPAGDGLEVTIPERRYELIAEILADGMAAAPDNAVDAAAHQAYQRGQVLGAEVRAAGGGDRVLAALGSLGFEPARDGSKTLLHNCPFHALAVRHTELVCGLNHAFLRGLAEGLGANVDVVLAPRPGACCVEFAERPPAGSCAPERTASDQRPSAG
ncbi:MAG TPA: helix-turn-helix domain-containing protein [Micromonosporaceae bacterium]|nr:helix-turn-helix domain-containing protein [Micromonosporaceae bacterium]